MTKEKQHTVTIFAYMVKTPRINIDTTEPDLNYYNSSLFEGFLNEIINTDFCKYRDGERYFHLHSIKQSNDADVLQGKIHTTRYGQLSDIINTDTSLTVSTLEPVEGVKNEINFVINRQTGLLLIQGDPFRIVNRNFLFEFLKEREDLAMSLVKKFNEENSNYSIYENSTFILKTIYDEGFYDQLAKIQNVKSFSINTKIDKSDVNSALEKFTKDGSNNDDYLNEVTEMTYTFKNTIRNNGVKHVKRFVQNALNKEVVDSIIASGSGEGKQLKAEYKVKPQSYPVKTKKNSNGIINQDIIIEKMIHYVKTLDIGNNN